MAAVADAAPAASMDDVVEENLRQLDGLAEPPGALCGWSFGDVVALAVAQRLVLDGRPVGAVLLLDTYLALIGPGGRRSVGMERPGRGAQREVETHLRSDDQVRARVHEPRQYEGRLLAVTTTSGASLDSMSRKAEGTPLLPDLVHLAELGCGHHELVDEPHVTGIAELVEEEMSAVRRGSREPDIGTPL